MSRSLDEMKEYLLAEKRLLQAKLEQCDRHIEQIETLESEELFEEELDPDSLVSSTSLVKMVFENNPDEIFTSKEIAHVVDKIMETEGYYVSSNRKPSQFVHGVLYNLSESNYLEKLQIEEDGAYYYKKV